MSSAKNTSTLIQHGVSPEDAERLLEQYPDVDSALEQWWTEQFGDYEDDPVDDDAEDELKNQLVSMGFSEEAANAALISTNYDILTTILILTMSGAPTEPQKEPGHVYRGGESYTMRKNNCSVLETDSDSDEEDMLLTTAVLEKDQITILCDPTVCTKVLWCVSKTEIDDWLLPAYDNHMKGLVLYLKNCQHSTFIKTTAKSISIQTFVFHSGLDQSKAASMGIFLSFEEAERHEQLENRVRICWQRAREAADNLRPKGGEFKNSWESAGPEDSMGNSLDIRKALEIKFLDISKRISEARAAEVDEGHIMRFSFSAIQYVTALLDLSIIRDRKKHKHSGHIQPKSARAYKTPVKIHTLRRQKTVD
tara:strand:+ start:10780 stop:11874 length:1095 start_codon:yes stop_codon:yes gene_type:complete